MSQVLRHLSGHPAAHLAAKGHRSVSASGVILLASLGMTGGLVVALGIVMRLYPAG